MKTLKNICLYSCFLSASLMFNGCTKDEPEPNSIPVIDVGDEIVGMTGTTINISVDASDADNNPLTFSWDIIESPAGGFATIANTGNANFTFNTGIAGFYRLEITADDGKGGKASGTVKLYIGGVLPSSISSNTLLPDLFDDEKYPDYYAINSMQITAGLTLEPGVVIENGADVSLWFNGNTSYINAEGTSGKNIIFRGVDKVKGSWKVIEITSNNVNNKFNYVQILHAGSSETSNKKTAVLVKSNVSGRVSIKNTTIKQSGGYAIYIDGNTGTFTEFSNNNFSDNAAAPLRIGAEGLIALDNNSVYTNNGIQAIEVASAGNTNVRFNNTAIIKKATIPYHFYSSAELRATVTFEAGITCFFNSGLRLWITSDGAIVADGTAANSIIFSSLTDAPGAWSGIEIASPSAANKINYGIISNGGNTGGRGANIYMFGSSPGSQLTISNSTISNSQTYGIQTSSGAINLTQSNNSFISNASGDLKQN